VTEGVARPAPPVIRFRPAAVRRLLGVDIPEPRMQDILAALELEVDPAGPEWQVRVPAFRFDLATETDLIEEIARVHGYDAIPATLPRGPARPALPPAWAVAEERARRCLAARGCREAITYSFIAPELAALFDGDTPPLALANPISRELSVLRRSLWPGLASAIRHNLNRQHEDVRLFEVGMVFAGAGDALAQPRHVAGARYGDARPPHWSAPRREGDFYDLKRDVEVLLRALGEDACDLVPGSHPALHPGQAAAISRDGRVAGWLGRLHPRIQHALELPKPLFLFEFDLEGLRPPAAAQYQPVSRFPAVRRDLAIVVDAAVSAATCLEVARDAAGSLLRDLELFDVYDGQGIDSGKKSLALGLIFQDLSSTLTEDEVEKAMRRVLRALQERVQGTLRE
jgi:phenylalanyl-tRNA synthetase beta chain